MGGKNEDEPEVTIGTKREREDIDNEKQRESKKTTKQKSHGKQEQQITDEQKPEKNKMAITVYSRFCIKSVLRINAEIKKKNLLHQFQQVIEYKYYVDEWYRIQKKFCICLNCNFF